MSRRLVQLAAVVLALALGASAALLLPGAEAAPGAPPAAGPPSGTVAASGQVPSSYATSTALGSASTVGLKPGTKAWVTNQGEWVWTGTACPSTCDGANACGTAPCAGLCTPSAGSTCWLRGGSGYPGSGAVAAWYVRTGSTGLTPGSDGNDCQSPSTPCLTEQEIQRRARGQQPPTQYFVALIHLLDDVNGTHVIDFPSPWLPDYRGVRNYGPTDGGAPYWRGTVTAVQKWSNSQQEGIVTVAPVDGGAAFNAATWATGLGYFLEVQDGGAIPGLALTVGEEADGGSTFYTSSWLTAPGSYTLGEATVGDPVAIYRPTGFASDANSQLLVIGTGATFGDLVLGNQAYGAGSVELSMGGAYNSAEFDSCVVNGVFIGEGALAFGFGSAFPGGHRVFGEYVDEGGLLDALLPRENIGWFETYGPTLVGMWNGSYPPGIGGTWQGVFLGSSNDGAGRLVVGGQMAIVGYFGEPALSLRNQSDAYVAGGGALWMRNSIGNVAAIDCGGGSRVHYVAGAAPAVVGTAPSPKFLVRGVGYSTLPVSDPDAGAWITQE